MERKMFVRCECGEEHDSEEVEFLNVESDIQGRDVLTFLCSCSEDTQKSLVFSRG